MVFGLSSPDPAVAGPEAILRLSKTGGRIPERVV